MKVFVAGATGVLGRAAVKALAEAGHDVTGVARSSERAAIVEELGGNPIACELFDAESVSSSVPGHDVVCNFATHIPVTVRSYWRGWGWSTNNRLHRETSRLLVDAALQSGVERYIQHSVGFMYADGGEAWLDEESELDPPPHGLAVLEAEAQAERFSASGRIGVSLRFGFFYGPDAPSTRDQLRMARMGFVAMAGLPDAYLPLIHTDDLGPAAAAALGAPAGAYNVVDDSPITRAGLAEVLAPLVGRKHLRIVPRALTRMLGKRYAYLSRSQRVSNARFKQAASWSSTVRDSREGWKATVDKLQQ